jgi:flagellar basal-body rod modification protein FlgD
MGLGPVLGAGAPATSAPAPSGGTPPGGALGEQAFLQLLVAQMQYQDPLQPMDSTEFVTQLAQFETLAVLQHIQADLDALVARQGAGAAPSGSAGGGTGTAGSG